MQLNGWDTVSLASTEMVNRSLAQCSQQLIERFAFRDATLSIAGEFTRWRIVPGGSPRMLVLKLDLANLVVQGLPGYPQLTVNQAAAVVEVGLKLLPIPGQPGCHALSFDFNTARGEEGQPAVNPIDLEVSNGALNEMMRTLILNALCACLAANADQIRYVLATLGTSNPAKASWLTPKQSDWVYVETTDSRSYLAVLSTTDERDISDLPRAVDPNVLAKPGTAVLGIANDLLLRKALIPYLGSAFSAPNAFRYDTAHGRILSTRQIKLKPEKHGAWRVQPYIDSLCVRIVNGRLEVDVAGHGDLPMGLRVDYTVKPRMPFTFDPNTRVATFAKDKHPKVTKRLSLAISWLDTLIGWFVRFVTGFVNQSMERLIRSVASGLHVVNALPPEVSGWTGLQAFACDDAQLEQCLVIRDQQSMQPAQQAAA